MRSKGEKNFDRCGLKKVEYKDTSYEKDNASVIYFRKNGNKYVKVNQFNGKPAIPVNNERKRENVAYLTCGWGAEMLCPRLTEENRTISSSYDNNAEPEGALNSLRKNAVELMCSTCPYVGKTELEVIEMRAEKAEATARLLRAQAALREAQEEIKAIEQGVARPTQE